MIPDYPKSRSVRPRCPIFAFLLAALLAPATARAEYWDDQRLFGRSDLFCLDGRSCVYFTNSTSHWVYFKGFGSSSASTLEIYSAAAPYWNDDPDHWRLWSSRHPGNGELVAIPPGGAVMIMTFENTWDVWWWAEAKFRAVFGGVVNGSWQWWDEWVYLNMNAGNAYDYSQWALDRSSPWTYDYQSRATARNHTESATFGSRGEAVNDWTDTITFLQEDFTGYNGRTLAQSDPNKISVFTHNIYELLDIFPNCEDRQAMKYRLGRLSADVIGLNEMVTCGAPEIRSYLDGRMTGYLRSWPITGEWSVASLSGSDGVALLTRGGTEAGAVAFSTGEVADLPDQIGPTGDVIATSGAVTMRKGFKWNRFRKGGKDYVAIATHTHSSDRDIRSEQLHEIDDWIKSDIEANGPGRAYIILGDLNESVRSHEGYRTKWMDWGFVAPTKYVAADGWSLAAAPLYSYDSTFNWWAAYSGWGPYDYDQILFSLRGELPAGGITEQATARAYEEATMPEGDLSDHFPVIAEGIDYTCSTIETRTGVTDLLSSTEDSALPASSAHKRTYTARAGQSFTFSACDSATGNDIALRAAASAGTIACSTEGSSSADPWPAIQRWPGGDRYPWDDNGCGANGRQPRLRCTALSNATIDVWILKYPSLRVGGAYSYKAYGGRCEL